jgi:hypothetical protein
VRNKSFDTPKYYALEITPYFLNASTVACPYCNLPGRKFCSPIVFVLWYTGTRLADSIFLPNSTSNNTPQRSLTPHPTMVTDPAQWPSIYPSNYPSIYPSISTYLPTYLSIHPRNTAFTHHPTPQSGGTLATSTWHQGTRINEV